eukprot:3634740-Amphidinium_carterae.1
MLFRGGEKFLCSEVYYFAWLGKELLSRLKDANELRNVEHSLQVPVRTTHIKRVVAKMRTCCKQNFFGCILPTPLSPRVVWFLTKLLPWPHTHRNPRVRCTTPLLSY